MTYQAFKNKIREHIGDDKIQFALEVWGDFGVCVDDYTLFKQRLKGIENESINNSKEACGYQRRKLSFDIIKFLDSQEFKEKYDEKIDPVLEKIRDVFLEMNYAKERTEFKKMQNSNMPSVIIIECAKEDLRSHGHDLFVEILFSTHKQILFTGKNKYPKFCELEMTYPLQKHSSRRKTEIESRINNDTVFLEIICPHLCDENLNALIKDIDAIFGSNQVTNTPCILILIPQEISLSDYKPENLDMRHWRLKNVFASDAEKGEIESLKNKIDNIILIGDSKQANVEIPTIEEASKILYSEILFNIINYILEFMGKKDQPTAKIFKTRAKYPN